MTDLEINKALALAIGWGIFDFAISNEKHLYIDTAISEDWPDYKFRLFDYRDPVVIWPIAERYNMFPRKSSENWWTVKHPETGKLYDASTAARAVAKAVIESQKK